MRDTSYDALAPHFQVYARSKAGYCDGVDRVILSWLGGRTGTWLDVGSGDGGRAVRLATAAHATRLVLSDPSPPMAALCRQHGTSEVWETAAEDLRPGSGPFDVITCLWNVLGLIDGTAHRIAALTRMRSLLAGDGRLFVDAHNRYNARTAGRIRVWGRRARDWVWRSDTNGAVTFTWRIAGEAIESRGYLFAPAEMRRLAAAAELRVVRESFIDYATGGPCGRGEGQMLFELAKD